MLCLASFLYCQNTPLSDSEVRSYFDKNGAEGIEGIWESVNSINGMDQKLSIIKDGYKYFVRPIHENRDEIWNTGEILATIETAASDEIVTMRWKVWDRAYLVEAKSIGTVKNNSVIEFSLKNTEHLLYRVYPKLDQAPSSSSKINKDGNW